MEFEKAYLEGRVDPYNLFNALEYLITSELYREENIEFDLETYKNLIDAIQNLPTQPSQSNTEEKNTRAFLNLNFSPFNIAPAEGLDPVSLLANKYTEELSFPKIYCGNKFTKSGLSYSLRCKSEFRRFDRRCQLNINKVFYSARKLLTIKIHRAITIMASNQTAKAKHNVDFYRQRSNIQNLIDADNAFVFLTGIRSSPQYWHEKKETLKSMIKQIGQPTFFLTLSPNESENENLIKCLLHHSIKYRGVRFESLTPDNKTDLIASDPIMTSRYYNHQTNAFFKHVILSDKGPFKNNMISDYFIRVEFQKRGSPHQHIFLWCDNINLKSMNEEEKINLADKYIKNDVNDINLMDIKTQIHRHMPNCSIINRFGNQTCKTEFPRPVLDESVYIEKFSGSKKLGKKYNDLYMLIQNFITEEYNNHNFYLTMQDILNHFNITYEFYLSCISTSLRFSQVVQKRNIKSVFCNNYNENIFNQHKANMDIQLVSDPQQAVSYITSYLVKSDSEVAEAVKRTCDELNQSDMHERTRLFKLARVFLNKSSISAQECGFQLLGMPITKFSRKSILVNTMPKNLRGSILKRDSELKEMEHNSTDVFITDMFWYYENRPEEYNAMCLADFATLYDKVKTENESSNQLNFTITKDNIIYLFKRRSNQKILRYYKYDKDADSTNFTRVLCLLFLPFRDEVTEIENVNIISLFNNNKEEIMNNYFRYNCIEIEEYEREAIENRINEDPIVINEEEYIDINGYEADNDIPEIRNQPIRINAGITTENEHLVMNMENLNVNSFNLNIGQRNYIQKFKIAIQKKQKFYHLVLGGAGTGKSYLINAVENAFTNLKENENYKVIRSAFTGKASFNIRGITLHSLFHIPTQQKDLEPLTDSTLREDRKKWQNIKILIIDEISMVGASLMKKINLRLQQIFDNGELFGGMSIVAFGDLKQLAPVMDSYCFSSKDEVTKECWNLFKLYELSEVMRQRDDREFAECLNKIGDSGIASISNAQVQMLNSRIYNIESIPQDCIFICSTNEAVNQRNRFVINNLPGETIECLAVQILKGQHSRTNIALNRLEASKTWPLTKTCNLTYNLLLKIDVKYTVTLNLSLADGLVNGSVGVLKKIIKCSETNTVTRLWLKFFENDIGKKQRENEHYKKLALEDFGTTTDLVCIEKNCQKIHRDSTGKDIVIERIQFPLYECEAITIHKSQGMTYQKIAVNISERMKRAMQYVALSRVTSLSGLYLYGSNSVLTRAQEASSQSERVLRAERSVGNDALSVELRRLRQPINKL